ncbi:DUF1992 domain-containing protein [Microbacterium gorillae]|uniref:DnaJ family domain-containing protein n=1 Tax=Microbacterium gorillae TaxID=1231063 RepID=UPI003D984F45
MTNDPRDAAAEYRAAQAAKGDGPIDGNAERDGDEKAAGPANGQRHGSQGSEAQRTWTAADRAAYVETAIQRAIREGAFDDLPGAGKPIEGLGTHHDPDWWIRRKIQTEDLRGLGPAALTLRVEDREFEERMDALTRESDVREAVEDFNRRVKHARLQLLGGPPVVTALRDVDTEVQAWRDRRAQRTTEVPPPPTSSRGWFRRNR